MQPCKMVCMIICLSLPALIKLSPVCLGARRRSWRKAEQESPEADPGCFLLDESIPILQMMLISDLLKGNMEQNKKAGPSV